MKDDVRGSETHNQKVTIGGVQLTLSQPDTSEVTWIGQSEILKQVLACWLVVGEKDLPLAPRITGMPGIGKTTLAMVGARIRKQPLYIFQCTADTRPEDLLVTPVLSEAGTISLAGAIVGSPPLCRIHHCRYSGSRPQGIPRRRHHEQRRIHL